MRINLPRTDRPLTKVTASAGNWGRVMYAGRPFRDCEIQVPEGIDESEVEVIPEPCDGKGVPFERIVIKVGKPRSVVQIQESVPVSPVQTQDAEPAVEVKLKKKRTKRGQEIAGSVDSTDLDNTRSQVNVVDDERDAG